MSDLATQLDELQQRFAAAIAQAPDERALDAARVAYLGRSGEVTNVRRTIGALPPDERPAAGKTINDAVEKMEGQLVLAAAALENRTFEADLAQSVDVTFPSIPALTGSIHPVRRVIEDVATYFASRIRRGSGSGSRARLL